MDSLCCSVETPFEHKGRLSASQLKSIPVPIWWHRRRIYGPASSSPFAKHNNDEQVDISTKDNSPFPKSWSVNYSGKSVDGILSSSDQIINALESKSKSASFDSDKSSVFSTESQEQRLKRDAFGTCVKHPHIQLARRKQTSSNNHQLKSRFSKMFSKHHNINTNTSSDNSQKEQWVTIHKACPECEKEHVQDSKARYHYKPKPKAFDTTDEQIDIPVTHVPFPATLTLIESHPQLTEGTLALCVRTDPVPADQTMHLSCASAATPNGDGRSLWEWFTPDGVLDSLIPADSKGEIKQIPDKDLGKQFNSKELRTPTKKKEKSSHQIMERIIPLSSIDHVSRGGDAWDILRQSTGENDFGCNCDVKIHGFSDRLLRFDVVNFNGMQSNVTKNNAAGGVLRYSFAGVDFSDFSRFSITAFTKNSNCLDHDEIGKEHGEPQSDSYTTENVISKLNSTVLWDREGQKQSVSTSMKSLKYWIYDCLSLGVPIVDDNSNGANTEVKEKKASSDAAGRYSIDTRHVL